MKPGWERVALAEIAELRGRIGWKGLTAKEYTETGPLFLSVHSLNYGDYVDFRDAFHISEARYDESPEIMLQHDDILICKDGAGIGKLGIVPELPGPTTINSSLLLIRPGSRVVPKYLYYCLLSPYFQSIVQSRLEGATTPHLYQRDISTFPVVLPPRGEQAQIVELLDRASKGLAKAQVNVEANLSSAEELFAGVLEEAFAAPTSNAGTSLSDLIEIDHGYAFEGRNFEVSTDVALPIVLTPGNYTEDARLDFSAKNTKRLTTLPPENFRLQKGELTIVMTDLSSKMKILGKPAFIDRNNILHNQRIGRVRFRSDALVPRYLFHFLRTRRALDPIKESATGTMVRHTAPKRILSLRIPTIGDHHEQHQTVARIDSIEGKIAALKLSYKEGATELPQIRQALLQRVFAGELA